MNTVGSTATLGYSALIATLLILCRAWIGATTGIGLDTLPVTSLSVATLVSCTCAAANQRSPRWCQVVPFCDVIKAMLLFISSVWAADFAVENAYRIAAESRSCPTVPGYSPAALVTRNISHQLLSDIEINTIITRCILNQELQPTVLDTNFSFRDYQEMYFTSDLQLCIPPEVETKLYNYVSAVLCPLMGSSFKPAPSSQFSWWIMRYANGQNIEPHHDTEALARDGWTAVFILDSSGSLVHQDFAGSTQTSIEPRTVHFLPHHNLLHHTPLLASGNRTVLQLKGGSQTLDSPLFYVFRRSYPYTDRCCTSRVLL